MVWLVGITEAVFRHARPETAYGDDAPWRSPGRGVLARLGELVANSRALRVVGRWIPGATMSSDITDVVYINYLLEADRLEPLVIRPLQLQRLGPEGRYALFTFLTFRHGHFGPSCFGPLRRLWPSPIQSNWRIHVFNPATGTRGIQFLTTAITSTPHALVTRLLTDGVPMHVPRAATLERGADGHIELSIEPGNGTAPDARGSLDPCAEPALSSEWSLCFATWRDLLAYCVPQDRAMGAAVWSGEVTRQEITLGIPLEGCRPVAGSVTSDAAAALAGSESPLCFVVDRVRFRFFGQRGDRSWA
jgi:hypothetical protein